MAAKHIGYSQRWGCKEGNTVVVTEVSEKNECGNVDEPGTKVKRFTAKALGLYDNFILLNKGKYRVTVSYADVCMGRAKVARERVR